MILLERLIPFFMMLDLRDNLVSNAAKLGFLFKTYTIKFFFLTFTAAKQILGHEDTTIDSSGWLAALGAVHRGQLRILRSTLSLLLSFLGAIHVVSDDGGLLA